MFFSGEFTLRAFLNGRLDLSQAENVGRLITAKSVADADAALAGIQACLIQLCFDLVMRHDAALADGLGCIYGCLVFGVFVCCFSQLGRLY